MSGHFNAIIAETEDARTYIIDEMIPYAEETKELAESLQDELVRGTLTRYDGHQLN